MIFLNGNVQHKGAKSSKLEQKSAEPGRLGHDEETGL